ncbi:hypothetical protein OVS_02015 [Mycoplasma ovis str. Michigan]|uniref:Uncharacterized protein n=1 Tax=Mycoplasma ovis str. Michigan TaxID=1415773 RepID=A0ABM5P1C6_9MOLU|nr:hypothetical protein [Mycoplasma ovis]AHC40269.1 hypothetical protein OVS_02015 [Mycoplasma ovis str. Michigan]
MSFFNLGLAFKCGLTFGSCLSIPAFINLVGENSALTTGLDEVSAHIPILNCKQHGKHYRVYLTSKEINEWNAKDSNYISLKVLDSNNKDNIVWRPNVKEGEKWTNWALMLQGGEKSFIESSQRKYEVFVRRSYFYKLRPKKNKT